MFLGAGLKQQTLRCLPLIVYPSLMLFIDLGLFTWAWYPLSPCFNLPSLFFNTVSLLFRAKRKHRITEQLIMATSGEGSNPGGRAGPRPLAQLQELEPRVARRRLSQARHRATLAGLFNILRKTVYSQSDLTASKVWGTRGCEGLRSKVGTGPGPPPHPTQPSPFLVFTEF